MRAQVKSLDAILTEAAGEHRPDRDVLCYVGIQLTAIDSTLHSVEKLSCTTSGSRQPCVVQFSRSMACAMRNQLP